MNIGSYSICSVQVLLAALFIVNASSSLNRLYIRAPVADDVCFPFFFQIKGNPELPRPHLMCAESMQPEVTESFNGIPYPTGEDYNSCLSNGKPANASMTIMTLCRCRSAMKNKTINTDIGPCHCLQYI